MHELSRVRTNLANKLNYLIKNIHINDWRYGMKGWVTVQKEKFRFNFESKQPAKTPLPWEIISLLIAVVLNYTWKSHRKHEGLNNNTWWNTKFLKHSWDYNDILFFFIFDSSYLWYHLFVYFNLWYLFYSCPKKVFLSRCIQMKRNKSSLHTQPTIFYLFSEKSKLGSKTKHQCLRRAVDYE